MAGDDEGHLAAPISDTAPPPPQRGWYRDPVNPNYERFWDGQKWVNRRYWGGGVSPDRTRTPDTAPPPGPRPPSRYAPVQYRGFFDVPFNPRSPARQILVACLAIGLFAVYVSLHLFPLRVIAILVVIGLVSTLMMLPARLRFLRDPARQAAIREPICYEARVWLRFTYAPGHWPYPSWGRSDIGVRTDSFQLTNWVWGSRDRARSTFFHAANAVMWREVVDGRDCIVVSGPTYRRSKVEFAFETWDGSNAAAWQALQAAGVQVSAPLPASPPAPATAAAPAPAPNTSTGFRRVGSDLGGSRAAAAAPTTTPTPASGPDVPPEQPSRRLRPPIRARRVRPAAIAVVVAFVLLAPILLATIVRLTTDSVTDYHFATTQCALNPGRTEVEWSGTLAANSHYPYTVVWVAVHSTSGAFAGSTFAPVPFDDVRSQPTPLGPVSIPVTGAPSAVTCATLAETGGR